MNNDSIKIIMNILDGLSDYTDELLFEKSEELNMYLNETSKNIQNIETFDSKKQINCIKCDINDIILVEGNNICKKCGKLISREIEIGKNLFEQNNGYTLISTTLMPVNNNGSFGYTKTNTFNTNNYDASKDNRHVYEASKAIRDICNMAKFSKKIQDTAIITYITLKQSMKLNKKPGSRRDKKKKNLIAICVREACIVNKNLCNNKQFAKYCNMDPKELTKGNKMFAKLNRKEINNAKPNRITAIDHIPKLCQDLLMDEEYIKEALIIANNINKLYLCSNFVAPTVSPAIVLIIITKYNLPIHIKKLAQYSSTSPPTINKCYNRILPYLTIISNNDKTDKIVKSIYINNMPRPIIFEKMFNEINN